MLPLPLRPSLLTHARGSLLNHRKSFHEKAATKFKCPFPECKYSTSHSFNLKKHTKTHETDPEVKRPFPCNTSGCSYTAHQLRQPWGTTFWRGTIRTAPATFLVLDGPKHFTRTQNWPSTSAGYMWRKGINLPLREWTCAQLLHYYWRPWKCRGHWSVTQTSIRFLASRGKK